MESVVSKVKDIGSGSGNKGQDEKDGIIYQDISTGDSGILNSVTNSTNSSKYTAIGQVMYNGQSILQHVEGIGSITGQPSQDSEHEIISCGRLPAMSKAIEVADDEIIDKYGKNINQMIN